MFAHIVIIICGALMMIAKALIGDFVEVGIWSIIAAYGFSNLVETKISESV